jgi:DNA topoisomerase IB
VIPPAWTDVWITPYTNGHLQAVGTDAQGRQQYLYHDAWRQQRDLPKHQRVLQFGAALPKARERVMEPFTHHSWVRERVLAVAFRLLDRGHFRIGGAGYVQTNRSYGLSTLLRTHVRRRGGAVIFDYTAKSGIHRVERMDDEPLVEAVSSLARRRPGSPGELLAYRTGSGWRGVTGEEINEYVRTVTGLEVSAKDFRTWRVTALGRWPWAWRNSVTPPMCSGASARRTGPCGAQSSRCRRTWATPGGLPQFLHQPAHFRSVPVRDHHRTSRHPRGRTRVGVADLGDPAEVARVVAELGGAPGIERAVLRMLKE